ncbi:MAG TPA: hypothetical protein VFZ61_04455, partial [Polyangiales bacterium]
TVRVRLSMVGPQPSRPAEESPRHRRMLMGTVGALALALGLAVGIVQVRTEPSVASAQLSSALPGLGKTSPAPLNSAPLAPAKKPAAAARLHVEPAHAVSVLNGRVLGSGDVQVPHAPGDQLHELRVSAPGYVTRVVLFRGAPQESSIALAREQ